jgi:hypothetical protein
MAYLEMLLSEQRNEAEAEPEPLQTPAKDSLALQWYRHRGEIFLVVAVILLGVATMPYAKDAIGDLKSKPVSAQGSSLVILLSRVGLASATNLPDSNDHNSIRVWVDLPAQLYYCPGDRRYGKTRSGRFTTQHDARLSQYEPAAHKVCD